METSTLDRHSHGEMVVNQRAKNQPFGVDRGVYSVDLYDAINSFTHDIPFWLEQARMAKGPVLELCCGTGRITVPLANAGIPVVGADLSHDMLKGLQQRASKAGVLLDARIADMRSFSFEEKFNLIFIPFNSFQCLYTLSDVQNTLACVRKHLAPGGRFVLDVFNPSLELMVDRSRNLVEQGTFELPVRGLVNWKEKCHYEAAAQVNRVTWLFSFEDGTEEIIKLDLRCFYPLELELLMTSNGFTIENRIGNYDLSPFVSNSPKQILFCS